MDAKAYRVAALMTAARYENTYCRNAIESALRDAQLRLTISLGVFYGQCMQSLMENAIAEGCDIILTIDGDSIFNSGHVNRLLAVLCNGDKIDALASMQARRSMPYPLFTTGADKVQSVSVQSDVPFRVATAHFGLTAIKVAPLCQVGKPWFFAQASDLGTWGKDTSKIDDDVWFWRQWEKFGKTLYVDPGCRIGHMEEMVSYYDDHLQLKHIYPSDWHDEQRRIQEENQNATQATASMAGQADGLCLAGSATGSLQAADQTRDCGGVL